MDSTISKQQRGKQLSNAKRMVIIGKLIDYLSESYYSTSELAKMTGLSRMTIDRYRPLADEVIGKQKLDRNVIRNLQVKRTYKIIEKLTQDLELIEQVRKDESGKITTKNIYSIIKEKTLIYNQIAKFSQHLALITGLNVETHVNVDHQQLVIIRANNNKRPVIDVNETNTDLESTPDIITIKDEANPSDKQGHSIPQSKKTDKQSLPSFKQ